MTSIELQQNALDATRAQNRLLATTITWLILAFIMFKIASNYSDKSKMIILLVLAISPVILWYGSGLIIPKKNVNENQ